jgi:hypothetical protein
VGVKRIGERRAVSVLDNLAAPNEGSARARLLSGRALVYEALAQWPEALADYNAALTEAVSAGYERARGCRRLLRVVLYSSTSPRLDGFNTQLD